MEYVEQIRRANLAVLKEELGSYAELSRRTGKSTPQISQWVKASPSSSTGKERVMSREIAREFERKLGKPAGWMDQPHTEPDYAPASDLPVATHRSEEAQAGIHRIPKLNVAGGQGHGALLPSVEYQSSVIEVSDEWLRANLPGIRISNLRAITGLGPSMHPTFSDGDILFTDVSVTRLVHDRIFALFDKETGELFIKRVTRYPLEECWSITSDNPLHNNPPMADKVPLEKIAAKLGVGGCVVGKWAFTKL